MIRAVLDTNALASGLVGFSNPASTPGQLLHAWRDGRFELVLSDHILVELSRTLQTPYFSRRIPADQISGVLALLRRDGRVVRIAGTVTHVATHPEDDLILATALSAEADFLVTGDVQLQRLGSYERVAIVSPRDFLDLLEYSLPR